MEGNAASYAAASSKAWARGNPAAANLVRHAFADVPGNSSLARSWAKFARAWPRGAQGHLLINSPEAFALWGPILTKFLAERP